MSNMKKALSLFADFLKFGCYTFGGGWSIIAQMQKKYVQGTKEISDEELLDLISVGRSLPGIMIGNISVLFGYHMAGIPGALACCIGMCTAPVVIIGFVTMFYTAFRDNLLVAAAMQGVRAAVPAIILSAAAGLMKSAYRVPPCVLISIAGFLLYVLFDVSCVALILGGAAIGLILGSRIEGKAGEGQ